MAGLSAPASTFMDTLYQTQFTMADTIRRAQGDALGLFGFGPNECDYCVISSGAHWRLREYAPANGKPCVLIIPAPIKRPYVWDLAPPLSVIRHCLDHRLRVYLLEWMPPSPNGQQAGISDYADIAITKCVAQIPSDSQETPLFLIGHSLGGTLAAIFCALEPENIRGLVLLGAPLCFEPGSSRFRDALVSLFPAMIPEAKVLPGSLLSQVSALASPDTFVWARLRDAALSSIDLRALEIHIRVERWTLDEVPLPGKFVTEIIELLYRENRFCRGTLSLRDQTLGPSNVQVPTLAVVNTADEIAPLDSVEPFLDRMPTKETRIIEYPGEGGVGFEHLTMLAGPQAHARIWPEIFSWLEARHRGSTCPSTT